MENKEETMTETIAQLESYKRITMLVIFVILFFGIAFLSLYLIAVGTMLIVLYVMIEIKIESMQQFALLKKFIRRENGKSKGK
jgi:hypothetical protein